MTKKKQESLQDKNKKSREQQEWAEQAGKNPDDLEIFTEPRPK
jgi:hypothetical protein